MLKQIMTKEQALKKEEIMLQLLTDWEISISRHSETDILSAKYTCTLGRPFLQMVRKTCCGDREVGSLRGSFPCWRIWGYSQTILIRPWLIQLFSNPAKNLFPYWNTGRNYTESCSWDAEADIYKRIYWCSTRAVIQGLWIIRLFSNPKGHWDQWGWINQVWLYHCKHFGLIKVNQSVSKSFIQWGCLKCIHIEFLIWIDQLWLRLINFDKLWLTLIVNSVGLSSQILSDADARGLVVNSPMYSWIIHQKWNSCQYQKENHLIPGLKEGLLTSSSVTWITY